MPAVIPRNLPAGAPVVEVGAASSVGLAPAGAEPNTQFWFAWHRTRWDYAPARGGWYPDLHRVHLDRGLNGVQHDGSTELLEVNLSRQEYHLIRPNDDRLAGFRCMLFGEPYTYQSYIAAHRVRGGKRDTAPRYHYRDIFSRPRVVGQETHWIRDEEAFAAFLAYLVTSGIVEPIDDLVRQQVVRQQQSVVERIEGVLANSPGNPLLASRLTTQMRRLAAMRGDDETEAEAHAEALIESAKQQQRAVLEGPAGAPAPTQPAAASPEAVAILQCQLAEMQAQMAEMIANPPRRKPGRKPGKKTAHKPTVIAVAPPERAEP